MTCRIFAPLASLLLAAATLSAAPQILQKGDVVAVCGDSITEQKAYSRFIEDYLVMCQPEADLKVFQAGWSGEKAPGFLQRMKNDVLPFHPTVATLCYGMNDGGYAATTPASLETYRKALIDVVKTFRESGVRSVVVGSPGVVDTATYKKAGVTPQIYNQTLADFGQAAKEVAEKEGVVFANVNGEMADVMPKAKTKYGEAYHVAGGDGVHPALNGHLVMAHAFLKALGCDGEIGRITLDMGTGQAEASDGHKVVRAAKDSVEIESTRYPFCFTGDPADPSATRGIIEFLPFNDDLNRFTLVVKNPPGEKLKVTWGATSREFTAADLQKGINLAAEFLDNPFSKPFQAVDTKVMEKQVYETMAIKSTLNSALTWKKTLPEESATVDRLSQSLVVKVKAKTADVRAAVVPVSHSIKVEAIP
jgi:lysophospholipase L1-like esterase